VQVKSSVDGLRRGVALDYTHVSLAPTVTVVNIPDLDLLKIQLLNDIGNSICAARSPRPRLDFARMFHLDIPRSDISLLKESLEEAGITCVDINPCSDSRHYPRPVMLIMYPSQIVSSRCSFSPEAVSLTGPLNVNVLRRRITRGDLLIRRPNAVQGRMKLCIC